MDASIKQLEILRKRAATLIITVIIIASAVALFGLFLFSALGAGKASFLLALLLGTGFGLLLAAITGCFQVRSKYKSLFKSTLVEVPFCNAFTKVTYDGTHGIDQEVIKNTGIIGMGNIYSSNDYVKGFYKGIQFERADVTIQQLISNGKTSYTVTYLRGRWFILEFNKAFQFDLQIISHEFSTALKKNSIFTEAEERRHKVELEDIDFNEKFKVLCQDEHEAYYILTPQFMQALKEMHDTMDGSFMLGFIDHKLHIAIHNNADAMEPRLFEDIDLKAIRAEVQREIDVIIGIIDVLTLDRDIFMKKEGE
jgi:Protein of unknown function (DUF3137).